MAGFPLVGLTGRLRQSSEPKRMPACQGGPGEMAAMVCNPGKEVSGISPPAHSWLPLCSPSPPILALKLYFFKD